MLGFGFRTTDEHGWIWLNDPLARVVVYCEAFAAGCDSTGGVVRCVFETTEHTEEHRGM
jgi:hypothetical protein